MHQVQGKAGTASSSSSQSTLTATDVGTKQIGLVESVCEDAEMGWLFMVAADAVAINKLSMGTALTAWLLTQELTCMCVRKDMPLTRLSKHCQNAGEVWIFDQQVVRCSRFVVCEVVCNAMDLHGKVFTVKIPFVVCEVRRPLLSLVMLEDKGFHLTVGNLEILVER